jgi:hypothetical protein
MDELRRKVERRSGHVIPLRLPMSPANFIAAASLLISILALILALTP